jgi:hypothetical protein
MTSTGSVAGRGIPHRYVADRCDAMPAGDAASTAAAIRCSGVSAAPGSRATPGWTASNRPERMARFHAEPLSPEAAFVINPWWVLAHSSISRSCIPERGCPAARTGTGGPRSHRDRARRRSRSDPGRKPDRIRPRSPGARGKWREMAGNGGKWREWRERPGWREMANGENGRDRTIGELEPCGCGHSIAWSCSGGIPSARTSCNRCP